MTSNLTSIYNYHQPDDRLATSGQPSEEQLAAIAQAGYRTIINLALHDDPKYSLPDEADTVRKLGLDYIHIPVQFATPTEADLLRFFAAMDTHANDKIWIHCAANWRVTAFLGLYNAIKLGQPREHAFALMEKVWQPNEVWKKFIDAMLANRRQP